MPGTSNTETWLRYRKALLFGLFAGAFWSVGLCKLGWVHPWSFVLLSGCLTGLAVSLAMCAGGIHRSALRVFVFSPLAVPATAFLFGFFLTLLRVTVTPDWLPAEKAASVEVLRTGLVFLRFFLFTSLFVALLIPVFLSTLFLHLWLRPHPLVPAPGTRRGSADGQDSPSQD